MSPELGIATLDKVDNPSIKTMKVCDDIVKAKLAALVVRSAARGKKK